jgi:two-component system nitrate/nitrite response regulator NarL
MGDDGVILVIDQDRRARTRTELILRPLQREVVCAPDAESALELVEARVPALVIVDVELPGLNGLGLLAQLHERFDDAVPVILTSAERTAPLDRAAGLLLGADDYLVKPVDPAELVARVGRSLRRAAAASAGTTPAKGALSPREREILGFLAEGKTQEQIADQLVISPKTVGTHIQHVLAKLGVHSRAQAVAEAYRSRLVTPEFEGHLLDDGLEAETDGGRLSPPSVALL